MVDNIVMQGPYFLWGKCLILSKSKKMKEKIEEILSRSVAEILPSKDDFRKKLLNGDRLRIYIGADATGPQLHIGHSTNYILLERLRKLGHEVVVLFGDFTAMIGDPTDKGAARIRLTPEQVKENIKSWKDQVSKIVNFEDKENPARIVLNSEWLGKLNFTELIDIASNFTVQRMMERDMFEKRLEEGKPIHLHEFFYPLMQGYDSVELDVDVEIGGTDQTFNMLAGRTLQKKYNNKEKFVITTTLLVNPINGKKLMSKSEGSFIALNDTPNEMFGKTMALPDETIVQVFIDCTHVSTQDIVKMEEEMKKGKANPRDLKIRLAEELVKIYHGEEPAKRAKEYFIKTFSKKEIPDEVAEFAIKDGTKLIEYMVESGLAMSLSDARRKIEQGGVEINGEKVDEPKLILTEKEKGSIIKVGKKSYLKIS